MSYSRTTSTFTFIILDSFTLKIKVYTTFLNMPKIRYRYLPN